VVYEILLRHSPNIAFNVRGAGRFEKLFSMLQLPCETIALYSVTNYVNIWEGLYSDFNSMSSEIGQSLTWDSESPAVEVAHLLIDKILCQHGLSRLIVGDRDSIYTKNSERLHVNFRNLWCTWFQRSRLLKSLKVEVMTQHLIPFEKSKVYKAGLKERCFCIHVSFSQ